MSDYYVEGSKTIIDKDPDSTLDYTADFSTYLTAITDTIASASVIVPTGITLDSSTNTTTSVTAWLSGGTAGTEYKITYRITTASVPARIDDRSIYVRVVEK